MKKISLLLIAGLAFSVLTSTDLIAKEKIALLLGTATPGGGFPVYGAAFAETINQIDPSLDVQPRNTKGSTEHVLLLEAGKLDFQSP